MATEHRVAEVDDFPEDGDRVVVDVDGREIGVFRLDGEFYALLNYCVHAGGPLCAGPLTGRYRTDETDGRVVYDADARYVQCPWHDWKFDVTNGRCAASDRYRVPTFETIVRDGTVYVRL